MPLKPLEQVVNQKTQESVTTQVINVKTPNVLGVSKKPGQPNQPSRS